MHGQNKDNDITEKEPKYAFSNICLYDTGIIKIQFVVYIIISPAGYLSMYNVILYIGIFSLDAPSFQKFLVGQHPVYNI